MSLIKCRAIVIRTINYSESSVVLRCYTDMHGVQSFLINGVRSKKGSIRPSQLLPLTLLELECYHHQHKSLHRIKELKCQPPLRTLHFDIVKSAVGMFAAELIHKSLHEENHEDEPLFSFLFHTIQLLDLEQESVANFPIFFMLQLTRYLGFYPKGAFSAATNGFDTKEGAFEAYDKRNPFQADPAHSETLARLLECDFEGAKNIKLNREQRINLLQRLEDYYREHIHGFSEMKSHIVLGEVLS